MMAKKIYMKELQAQLPGFQLTKIGSLSCEVWNGTNYVCLLSFCPKSKMWAATHNMVPDEGGDSYRYGSAVAAVAGYPKR
jgi:hypothetical protein